MSVDTAQNKNKYILLVDDEEIIRDLISEILVAHGYNVLTAANGQEALETYQQAAPINLLITDVKMPIMNGVVLVEKLRELDPDLKILVVSGLLEDKTVKRLTELKVDGIIEKPFIAEDYLKTIAKLI